MKKKKIELNETRTLSLELQTEISKLEIALSKLENDVNTLQVGDNDNPYWNGSNAYDVLSSCVGHMDHDKKLLDNLRKCSDYIISTLK